MVTTPPTDSNEWWCCCVGTAFLEIYVCVYVNICKYLCVTEIHIAYVIVICLAKKRKMWTG